MPRGRPNKRSKPAETETELTEMETIITHLHGTHVALNEIAKMLAEHFDLATAGQAIAERIAQALERGSISAEAPPKRVKKEPAPAPEKKPEPPPHQHDLEMLDRPGLARCRTCNAVTDVPIPEKKPAPASEVVIENNRVVAPPPEKAPAAPPPEKAPAIMDENELRATAISFANKHGKPKLSEILKKYGATNISSVPAEMRLKCIQELNGAGG